MANIILSNTDPNIIPNPPAGSTLLFFDLNTQPVLKDSLGVTQSFGGAVVGPQGVPGSQGMTGPQGVPGSQGMTGPQGFTGPQGLQGNAVQLGYGAIGQVVTAGLTGSILTYSFIEANSPTVVSFGTLFTPGTDPIFGLSASVNNVYEIYASADCDAGNNKVVGMVLIIDNGGGSYNVIAESECRSATGFATSFAKVVTRWIHQPSSNCTIRIGLKNHTDATPITVDRCRIVATEIQRN